MGNVALLDALAVNDGLAEALEESVTGGEIDGSGVKLSTDEKEEELLSQVDTDGDKVVEPEPDVLGLALDDGDVELDRDGDGESRGVFEDVSDTLALRDDRGVLDGDDDTLAHLDVSGLLVIEIVVRIVFVPVTGAVSLRVAARDQLALFERDPIDESDAEGLMLPEKEADGDIEGLFVSDTVGRIVFVSVRTAVRLKVATMDRLALLE